MFRLRLGSDQPFAMSDDVGDSTPTAGRVWTSQGPNLPPDWADVSVVPATSHIIHVSLGGSDTTGLGTSNRPFLTINRACTLVRTLGNASDTVRYCIVVGPGQFVENLVLSDFTWIIGSTLESTVVTFTTFAFGAEWTPNVIHRAGLQNMTISGATTVSFAAVNSQQGRLSFVNCWINALWTYVGFNVLNQVIFANCRLAGWTQTGIENFYLLNCTDPTPSNAILNAGGGLNASVFLHGTSLGGTLTANAPAAEFANIGSYASQVVGMLTLNGANASVTVDTSPRLFRGGVTLAGGAAEPRYTLAGAKAGNVALASVCTQLAATGGFVDTTT